MKIKNLFNYNILKVNKNKLLLANKYKLNAVLQIFRNKKKIIKRRKTLDIYRQNRQIYKEIL